MKTIDRTEIVKTGPAKQMATFKRYAIVLAVAILAILLFAMMNNRRQNSAQTAAAPGGPDTTVVKTEEAIPVEVAAVSTGAITDTVKISGDIAALTEVTLSSRISARILNVSAQEGDTVKKGDLLITLDASDLQTQIRSAQEALQAAKARAAQARVAVRLQQRTSQTQIENARETLRQAESRLALVRKGARAQERLVSESAVNVAQANVDDAQINYDRMTRLYREGAIAKSQVDAAETRLKVSRAQLQSAQQQLSLVEEGARAEEIEQAESSVMQARQNLAEARNGQRQIAMRLAELQAAEAQVRQAESAVRLAQQNRSYAFIRSSVSGIVSERMAEEGQLATPGTPLLRITVPGTVYFSATVPERDLGEVRVGQTAVVEVDVFPNQRFQGKVDRILPTGDPAQRTFTARITLPDAGGKLKPGMFARGVIQTDRRADIVMLPKTALTVGGSPIPVSAPPGGEGMEATVYVADGEVVEKRKVRIGGPSGGNVEVISGLEAGDRVVTSGTGLEEGAKIDVVN